MSVYDAAHEYAKRLPQQAGETPAVAFVVEIRPATEPRVVVISPTGKSRPLADYKAGSGRGSSGGSAWSLADLQEASLHLERLLWGFRVAARRPGTDPIEAALTFASRARERAIDQSLRRQLEQAQYELERPHRCVCGERYKSERGLKQHQRFCSRIDPFTGEPRQPAHPTRPETAS